MLWGLGQLQPEVQTGARGETGQPRHRREASWEKPNSVPPPPPQDFYPGPLCKRASRLHVHGPLAEMQRFRSSKAAGLGVVSARRGSSRVRFPGPLRS